MTDPKPKVDTQSDEPNRSEQLWGTTTTVRIFVNAKNPGQARRIATERLQAAGFDVSHGIEDSVWAGGGYIDETTNP